MRLGIQMARELLEIDRLNWRKIISTMLLPHNLLLSWCSGTILASLEKDACQEWCIHALNRDESQVKSLAITSNNTFSMAASCQCFR